MAFAQGGRLRGTYCLFEWLPAVDLWEVWFSPPFVDEFGLVEEATLTGDDDGPHSTLSLFDDAELVFAPERLVPRAVFQLLRSSRIPITAKIPAGPYVNARALVSHVESSIASGAMQPVLVENLNLPADEEEQRSIALAAQAGLQHVMDLLECLGLRMTIEPVGDRAADDQEPWQVFDDAP